VGRASGLPHVTLKLMLRQLAVLVFCCGAARAETVLVLPFFNHASTAGLDWIGESISESLHDSLVSEGLLALNREDRLEVYRRLSLRPGAELTHASVIKIGQALDATNVVYGYYEVLPADPAKDHSQGTLRISARIIDLKRVRQGPEFSELGALEDLARLELHLAWQALRILKPDAEGTEQQFIDKRRSVRLDAIESYTRGLLAQTAEQRHRFFTQAARLDDHYSQPCFQLGKASWASKEYQVAAGWLARVERTDPHYMEAQFLLGLCRYYSGDFSGAAQSFELVAASVPLNEVYNDLGAADARVGNTAGAIANFQKAIEGDGSDPDYHFNIGYTFWKSGKFAEAVTSLRAALQRNPDDSEATTLLGRALQKTGPRPGESRWEARERIKTNYEETAYRQLQAELGGKK
jgi:tetratricopeptide (TPR) repeat protein